MEPRKKIFMNSARVLPCPSMRRVHERQAAGEMHPVEKTLIENRMAGAVRRDQLGDKYHSDSGNDYWQRRASIAGPDYRELPSSYEKLRGSYKSFEEFMAAHKEFDKTNEQPAPKITINRKGTAHAIHGALNK